MTRIIPIASGKGGVGKTVLTANLGLALASKGKTVVLIDLDLGGSNLHTYLGIKNKNPGISALMNHTVSRLENLVIETGRRNLFFIPGDALLPGSAQLYYTFKKKLIREIKKLPADFILLDLGSGVHNNTLDFFIPFLPGIIVTTPEPAAIMNAYAFIKNCYFRMLLTTFRHVPGFIQLIRENFLSRIEDRQDFREKFHTAVECQGKAVRESYSSLAGLLDFIIVLNRGCMSMDMDIFAKFKEMAEKYLGISPRLLEYIRETPEVIDSVYRRVLIYQDSPTSPYSSCVDRLSESLIGG